MAVAFGANTYKELIHFSLSIMSYTDNKRMFCSVVFAGHIHNVWCSVSSR